VISLNKSKSEKIELN